MSSSRKPGRRSPPWTALARVVSAVGAPAAVLLFAVLARGQGAPPAERAFVGGDVCAGCHYVQHISWAKSAHARALQTLRPGASADVKRRAGLDPARDYTREPSCLACHTTGYGRPGGFVSPEATPKVADVGCEACHGAGSEYVERVMRRKFAFAHAEIDELGHIGYTVRRHSPAAADEASARPGHDGHGSHAGSHDGRGGDAERDRYGYDRLGDPPPWAHRHQGEILPLDPAKVSHCTVCHDARSPTHAIAGAPDFAATFAEQVRKGVHRRYGLVFIHW